IALAHALIGARILRSSNCPLIPALSLKSRQAQSENFESACASGRLLTSPAAKLSLQFESAMSRLRFSSIRMHPRVVALGTALFLLLSLPPPSVRASDTNVPATPPSHQEDTNSQEMLRVYLQLQEQLHATQLAIEENRKEAKEVAVQNAEILANRLHGIEAALAAQRARELEAMQSSNRVMLIVAGTFATFGFVVMLVIAYFQWRTVHGLAEMSTTVPGPRGLPAGEGPLVSIGPAEHGNLKLLG